MQHFAEDLRKKFALPVHLWDERLSSSQANRLLREFDLSIKKRAGAVDRMAAILILQSWMDTRDANEESSVITSKAANGYHFKSGQRK
jgi:putative Holliday junction resolvase